MVDQTQQMSVKGEGLAQLQQSLELELAPDKLANNKSQNKTQCS